MLLLLALYSFSRTFTQPRVALVGRESKRALTSVRSAEVEKPASALRLELRVGTDDPPVIALAHGGSGGQQVVLQGKRPSDLYFIDVKVSNGQPRVVSARIVALPNGPEDLAGLLAHDLDNRAGHCAVPNAPSSCRPLPYERYEARPTWDATKPIRFSPRWPDDRRVQLTVTEVEAPSSSADATAIARLHAAVTVP